MPIMDMGQRALQLWSVLVLAAMTRTVLTYEEVHALTGLPNNSGDFLGHIHFYCVQNNLPLLPTLVVGIHTGRPSFPEYNGLEIPVEHRRCFDHDWMGHGVPTPDQLESAYVAGMASA